MARITVLDLAAVVYSAGKVFDGLQTGRLGTEEFLRTGDTSGVRSMQDLALLRDLKDAAAAVIAHAPGRVQASFVMMLNAAMTRSASIEPGRLRRDDERIGVATRYGRHEPPAIALPALEALVTHALASGNPERSAATLFLAIAKAQPFTDGNKRTGIFAANTLLLGSGSDSLLTVPMSENDPSVAERFNTKLARAYLFGEDEAVIDALLIEGIAPAVRNVSTQHSQIDSVRLQDLKARIERRTVSPARPPHEDLGPGPTAR